MATSGLAILLLVGLLLRLTIAYVLLPGSGFESDIGTFTAWSLQLGQDGPGTFYASAGFADYPPGYLYVLWLIGGLGNLFAPLTDGSAVAAVGAMIKIPPMLADIAVGFVLYTVVRSWLQRSTQSHRLALGAAALYVFNPVTWYDSAIWGQTDALGALIVLVTVVALVRGNSEGSAVLAVLAALIKPQFGIVLLPVVGIVLLRRHLLKPGSGPHHRVLGPVSLRAWFETEHGPWRLISSAVSGLMLMIALLAPFSLDVFGFVRQMIQTAGGYPWLSVNAYNAWALISSEGRDPLAFGGGWSADTVALFGPLPAVLVGALLLAAGFAVGVLRLVWRDDRRGIIVVTIFLALAFFVLPTRVHERYMFPIFGLLPLLAAVDRRWLYATIGLSIAAFINLHGVLTTPLYATPNVESLPFGELFREPLGILTSVALHIAGFAFIAWHMRRAAIDEPDPYLDPVARRLREGVSPAAAWSTTPGPGAVEPIGAPGVEQSAPGSLAQLGARLVALVGRTSVRRDRSMLLVNERGGRIDRRDALLLVLLFVSALLLRTYRLEVPYSMHFDEVYHARTAVEFLQHWRYGMPHSIYEFTHPHLAKYAMAGGIAVLGNNRVIDTRELGVEVRGALTERRWSSPGTAGERNGDRLYVLTANEVRTYDLATRQPGPSVPGSFTALAVDETSHTLYLAEANGAISKIETTELDVARAVAGSQPIPPQLLTALAGLDGELVRLAVARERLVALTSGGTLISLEPGTGVESARVTLVEPRAAIGVPARKMVVVDASQVSDAQALAATLAEILSEDAGRIEGLLARGSGRVIVAGYIGTTGDEVQTAIDEGRLTGTTVEDGSAVAVATASGITLLEATTLVNLATITTQAPVTDLVLVEQGPDQPTIYATMGSELVTVRLANDQRATLGQQVQMPNSVERVVWNPATTMVHVLGQTQDGQAPTIYVVEPRSNSVFADARLESQPVALALDVQADRPAEDRDDLLALDQAGRLATVDVGNNQFAYRLPGVILGALMAVLIFLLGRFLFERRSVAIIASLLVLADGMFFANARIAMNDAYAAFFIVAALTVFVPLWLGRWKSGWATAGGLAAVGVLLGLALASKWVGAYAIGAVGLLILLRSALGRWIALVAMIGMTGVLGYIAVTPNSSAENPSLNYGFLILMLALTALLAVGMTLRPVRMTREELRLGLIAPLVPGALLLAYGAYRMLSGPPPVIGTTLTPSRLALIGAVLLVAGLVVLVGAWYAGRRGRGPLSSARNVDPERDPGAPPPPRGWLRPGSGRLGLPWIGALLAISVIPLAVYMISYVPWIELGNRWTENFPAGNTGQLFVELQRSMYDYHNNLRATHPASSPWWAWPLDLKPVWFEQSDYAGSTTAVIYDTGNLVIFWLSIPAVAWIAWQAWKRRSLALTFLAIAIASLWLPWARIDRATFQYHIFTTLPFSFLALAYFLAELWHGPSPRTWMLARSAAALSVIGAPLLWLLRRPLCGIANTEQVNSGTEVCAHLARDLALTDLQAGGLLLAIGGLVGAGLLVYRASIGARTAPGASSSTTRPLLLPISFSVALLGVAIVVIGAGLPGNTVLRTQVAAEEPALIALVLLAVPAYFVLRATDPRRFMIGILAAAAIWFVAFYPNISSLPVPTPLSQIHLGLLPTWNWGFQFGVNLDEPNKAGLSLVGVSMLTFAVTGLSIAAAYAARNGNAARGAEDQVSALPETN